MKFALRTFAVLATLAILAVFAFPQFQTVNGISNQLLSAFLALQTNSVSNSSQTTLNLLNSAATNGLTLTATNTSGGNVQLGLSGTLNNSGLANSSVTVNGTTCTLGSSCTPSGFYSVFQGTTGDFTMTGSDVTIYTVSNIPSLAAGACYILETAMLQKTGSAMTVKLKIDGTAISQPWGGTTASRLTSSAVYCNNSGSQAAQTLFYPFGAFFYWTSNTAGVGTSGSQGTDGFVNTPTGVDWTTTHTLTVTANQASGTVDGLYVHIGSH